MNHKKERLEVIWNIIESEEISSQEELLTRLSDYGITTTQATLSRDIKKLKIIKIHDEKDNYVYRLPGFSTIAQPQNQELSLHSNIEFSGNLAVVKTRPGYAMGIASDIDKHELQEILATIAGDDTILIIPREGISRMNIIKALKNFI